MDEPVDRCDTSLHLAAAAFWVIGWFMPPEKSSAKDKWLLFLLGAFGLYGFMFLYLAGLSKTTPVSSSIFTSLQPIWVFLIMIFFIRRRRHGRRFSESPSDWSVHWSAS